MNERTQIQRNLQKYDYNKEKYDLFQINLLIEGTPSHLTSVYKENLLFNEIIEYLDEFFHIRKTKKKLKDLIYVYNNYSYIFPNYTSLPESKYIYKNILKKQNLINDIESLIKKERIKKNNKNNLNNNNNNESKIFDSKIYGDILKETTNQSIVIQLFGEKIQNNSDSVKSVIDLTNRINKMTMPNLRISKKVIHKNYRSSQNNQIKFYSKKSILIKNQIFNSSDKNFLIKYEDGKSIINKNNLKKIFYSRKIFDLINNNKKIHKRNINNLKIKSYSSSNNISPRIINKKNCLFTENNTNRKYIEFKNNKIFKPSNSSLFLKINEKLKNKNDKISNFSQVNQKNISYDTKYKKYINCIKNVFVCKSNSNSGILNVSKKKTNNNNVIIRKIYNSNNNSEGKEIKKKILSINIPKTIKKKSISFDKDTNQIPKIEIKKQKEIKILDFSNKLGTTNTTSVSSLNPSSRRIEVNIKSQKIKNNNINNNKLDNQRSITEVNNNIIYVKNQMQNPLILIVPKIKKDKLTTIKIDNSIGKESKYKVTKRNKGKIEK